MPPERLGGGEAGERGADDNDGTHALCFDCDRLRRTQARRVFNLLPECLRRLPLQQVQQAIFPHLENLGRGKHALRVAHAYIEVDDHLHRPAPCAFRPDAYFAISSDDTGSPNGSLFSARSIRASTRRACTTPTSERTLISRYLVLSDSASE